MIEERSEGRNERTLASQGLSEGGDREGKTKSGMTTTADASPIIYFEYCYREFTERLPSVKFSTIQSLILRNNSIYISVRHGGDSPRIQQEISPVRMSQ